MIGSITPMIPVDSNCSAANCKFLQKYTIVLSFCKEFDQLILIINLSFFFANYTSSRFHRSRVHPMLQVYRPWYGFCWQNKVSYCMINLIKVKMISVYLMIILFTVQRLGILQCPLEIGTKLILKIRQSRTSECTFFGGT